MTSPAYNQLVSLLQARPGALRIALSGGIDSLTLMTVAAQVRDEPTIAMHAVSPAVPPEATARCQQLADRFDWNLQLVDAGEFENKTYISNPVDRCYYCKSSLFDRILACIDQMDAAGVVETIATGTNTDDLGDYRPGLRAASERQVWQPYVEAGISKSLIRQIAGQHKLGALSELPAQPCLSSRIETGIAIDATDLRFVHRVEKAVQLILGDGDIRCRITADGVKVQVPEQSAAFDNAKIKLQVQQQVQSLCDQESRRFAGLQQYQKGSAFLTHV